MKRGDHVGIGDKGGKTVELLCEVLSFDGETLEFFVLNGCWEGVLYRDGKLDAKWPSGSIASTSYEAAVLYTGPIRGRDYNEVMEFMDQALARNWLSRKLFIARTNSSLAARGFWQRLRRSCKAFSNAWHGRSQYDYDTIPF